MKDGIKTKFKFESESFVSDGRCNTIEVEITVPYHGKSAWVIEDFWDLTQCVRRRWHEFNEQDQADIQKLADKYSAIAEREDSHD